MIELGRLCVKIAGRDAGGKCIIVDVLGDSYVLVDGEVRRRKCNIAHLEPLDTVVKISKGASHDVIKSEFDKLGLKVRETKAKEKTEKPKKVRGKKVKEAEESKGKKKKEVKEKVKEKKEVKEEKVEDKK